MKKSYARRSALPAILLAIKVKLRIFGTMGSCLIYILVIFIIANCHDGPDVISSTDLRGKIQMRMMAKFHSCGLGEIEIDSANYLSKTASNVTFFVLITEFRFTPFCGTNYYLTRDADNCLREIDLLSCNEFSDFSEKENNPGAMMAIKICSGLGEKNYFKSPVFQGELRLKACTTSED